jgi:hypothetical protein
MLAESDAEMTAQVGLAGPSTASAAITSNAAMHRLSHIGRSKKYVSGHPNMIEKPTYTNKANDLANRRTTRRTRHCNRFGRRQNTQAFNRPSAGPDNQMTGKGDEHQQNENKY